MSQSQQSQYQIFNSSSQQSKSQIDSTYEHTSFNTKIPQPSISSINKKKEEFKKKLRRQYLDNYFQKKRTQIMKNQSRTPRKCNPCHKSKKPQEPSYLKRKNSQTQKKQLNNINYQQVEEESITVPIRANKNFNNSDSLKPSYPSNYLQTIILLQELILQQDPQQIQIDSYKNTQRRFKYKTLCDFLISIVSKTLDPAYFSQFNDFLVFQEHFNALKDLIYNKLVQQIRVFLKDISTAQMNAMRKKGWVRNISLMTCNLIIDQLWNFIQHDNLISRSEKFYDYPVISIFEQYDFLVKIFIEITYFDCPIPFEEQNQEIHLQQQSDGQDNHSQIYYKSIVNMYEKQNNLTHHGSITQYLIQNHEILRYFQNSICFQMWVWQNDLPSNYSAQLKSKLKDEIICNYLILFQNIMINVGSDIFHEEGIIKLLINRSNTNPFNVNIRRKQNSPYDGKKSIVQYKMKSLIVQSMQLLRKEKSLRILTQMDSIKYLVELLEKIDQQKKKETNQRQKISSDIKFHNIYSRSKIKYQDEHQFYDDSSQIQLQIQNKRMYQNLDSALGEENCVNNIINFLANQCIRCLQYFFDLGNYFAIKNIYQMMRYRQLNQQKKGDNKKYFEQYQIPQFDQNSPKKYSQYSNRYVVRFKYIIDSQEILQRFQKGRKLLELIQ